MDSSPTKLRVLFFAKSRELAGVHEAEFIANSKTFVVKELLDQLCDNFNLNAIKANLILAINENYCEDPFDSIVLKEGDELALIPPISGG